MLLVCTLDATYLPVALLRVSAISLVSSLEPGMGIEPTSAMNFLYTAGCGKLSAARRLNRSAFGDPMESSGQPRHLTPATNRSYIKL